MTDDKRQSIPEDFLEAVKQALEHLYDFPFLQRHALAVEQPPFPIEEPANEPVGHRLRRELIAAIETLNPGKVVSVRSGAARIYNLIHLHYVGGMTLQETALELGISLRQGYRDLRRGQESVADILWFNCNRHPVLKDGNGQAARLSSIQTEVSRIEGDLTAVDLTTILHTALKAVDKLAQKQNLMLHIAHTNEPINIVTNRAVAQQVLINILSQTIQQSQPGEICVTLEKVATGACVVVDWSAANPNGIALDAVITQLMDKLNWTSSHLHLDEPTQRLILEIEGLGASILIIDDNEGLVDLLERYFTGLSYQVISATSGAEGLELAQDLIPSAIVMDLMMPGMDGWELLQRLRTLESTQNIPVIICSVINDPELAYSLGASVFISKPVSRQTVLQAIQEVGI